MNCIKTVFLFSILTLFSSSSFGAWFITEMISDKINNKTKIGDKEHRFKVKDMDCWAGETQFIRMDDDYLDESRFLSCRTDGETVVSIDVHCEVNLMTLQALYIEKGNIKYFPALICGSIR